MTRSCPALFSRELIFPGNAPPPPPVLRSRKGRDPPPLTQPCIADWWPVGCRDRSLACGDRWREVLRSVIHPNTRDSSLSLHLRLASRVASFSSQFW
jgi:hypothetical protein